MKSPVFATARPEHIPDHLLTHVRFRANLAVREAVALVRHVAEWRAGTQMHAELVRHPDRPNVFDHYLLASRSFPSLEWSTLAGRAINEARSALDNLNALVLDQFAVGQYNLNRVYFPIAATEKDWKEWKQRHRAVPQWAKDRYRRVQPFQDEEDGFLVLKQLDNDRKHKKLTDIELGITGEISLTTYTVDGIVDADNFALKDEAINSTLRPGTRRVHVSRETVGHEVLDVDHDCSAANPDFELLLRIGDAIVPLPDIVQVCRRVVLAIEFVATGELQTYIQSGRAAQEASTLVQASGT